MAEDLDVEAMLEAPVDSYKKVSAFLFLFVWGEVSWFRFVCLS